MESGALRDVASYSCGVCNDDDSGATLVADTLTGYHTAGARNVRIAEATATSFVYIW